MKKIIKFEIYFFIFSQENIPVCLHDGGILQLATRGAIAEIKYLCLFIYFYFTRHSKLKYQNINWIYKYTAQACCS